MSDINIKVGLQGAAEVKAQMGYIQAAADSFASKLTNKFVSTFSAVAVGAMAFDKLAESINKNISASKQITSLSTKFHLDPKEVHSMMIAANNAGVAVRTLLQAMKQLTKYADASTAKTGNKDLMKQLFGYDKNGKEIENLDAKIQEISKTPAKFLPEVAMALAKINNEQDKTKVGTQLLGRQYQQLIPLLDQLAESEEARNNFLENGNAMSDEQIEQAKKMAQLTSDLQNSWDKFAASMLPIINQLANGLQLLGSWVEKIRLIGQMWRDEVTQETAKTAHKIGKYETALRKTVENKTLTKEQSDDLQKAKEGGMTQEQWIKKQVETYGDKEFEQRKNVAEGEALESYALGGGLIVAGGVVATIASGPAAPFVAGGLLLGGGAVTAHGIGASNEYNQITGSQNEFRKSMTEAEKKKAEKFEKDKAQRIATLQEERKEKLEASRKNTQGRIEYYNANAKGTANEIHEGRYKIRMEGNAEYASLASDYDAKESAIQNSKMEDNSNYSQAYNFIAQNQAQKSREEIVSEMMRVTKNHEDAIAVLKGAFGGEYHYNAKTGKIEEGKLEKRNIIKKGLEIEDKEGAKKKADAEKKYQKQKTKAERARDIAKVRAGEGSPEQEAVDIANEKVRDTEGDIAENAQLYREQRTLVENLKADVATKRQAVDEAEKAQDKAEKEGDMKALEKANKEAEIAMNAWQNAKTNADKEEKKYKEYEMEGIKLETELQNSKTEFQKATLAAAQKERELKEQARKDDEEWEEHLTQLKYKNMKKLGYSQQQIAEEQFLDSVQKYNEAAQRQADIQKEIDADIIERKKVARYNALMEGASEFGANMAELAVGETDEQKQRKRAARKESEKAFIDVDNAMENWEKIKPKAIVSELGRVGGGSAFQMGGSGPTDLLKEQVKLQRQLVHNTDPNKQKTKVGDPKTLTWGNKAVWGSKHTMSR